MDPARAEVLTCPFCTFPDPANNSIVEHIELYHPEFGKRFGVSGKKVIQLNKLKVSSDCRQHSSASEESGHLGRYTSCRSGCGEIVMDTELSTHLDLHLAEETTDESTSSQPELTAQTLSRPDNYEDLDNTQYLHGPFVKSQLKKEKPTQEAVREKRPRSSSDIALTVKKLGVSNPFPALSSLYLA